MLVKYKLMGSDSTERAVLSMCLCACMLMSRRIMFEKGRKVQRSRVFLPSHCILFHFRKVKDMLRMFAWERRRDELL